MNHGFANRGEIQTWFDSIITTDSYRNNYDNKIATVIPLNL